MGKFMSKNFYARRHKKLKKLMRLGQKSKSYQLTILLEKMDFQHQNKVVLLLA